MAGAHTKGFVSILMSNIHLACALGNTTIEDFEDTTS